MSALSWKERHCKRYQSGLKSANKIVCEDGRCPPPVLLNLCHLHVEATLDNTDSNQFQKFAKTILKGRNILI